MVRFIDIQQPGISHFYSKADEYKLIIKKKNICTHFQIETFLLHVGFNIYILIMVWRSLKILHKVCTREFSIHWSLELKEPQHILHNDICFFIVKIIQSYYYNSIIMIMQSVTTLYFIYVLFWYLKMSLSTFTTLVNNQG
jgi:hypothetical protein